MKWEKRERQERHYWPHLKNIGTQVLGAQILKKKKKFKSKDGNLRRKVLRNKINDEVK